MLSLLRRALRDPAGAALAAAAIAIAAWAVAYPFWVAHNPPITDLPFHAASMSILRHYLDPAFHFREQFSLHFLEVPYWTLYGLGTLFALVMPMAQAAKLAAVVCLALLPAGLAVMFHGMRKSPLLGLAGLGFVWTNLTHWGFINFVAAIGLFCMVVGFTLLTLDRPTGPRRVGLGVTLLLVFGTHIFRFPFALAAVAGTALVMWPATRRWRPLVRPVLPSLVTLAVWLAVRPKELAGPGLEPLALHAERFREIPGFLFSSFVGPEEQALAITAMRIGLGVAGASAAFFFVERRWRRWREGDAAWAVGVTVVALGIAGVLLVMFLVQPMQIGVGWYVYPREIVAALVVALGAMPDLPRARGWRAAAVGAIAYGTLAQAAFVAKSYAAFDAATADFREITARIPVGARLGYMVFDHGGSNRTTTPFIHLPAWVQAEKGGWLSFHFVSWNASPIRYRAAGPIPPPTPTRFEWTPERFDVRTRGKFFDWFLVRQRPSPEARFRADRTLELEAHVGMWWLYHRVRAEPETR